MSTIYSRQINRAQTIIKKKGTIVTWRKSTKTTNNSQPWKATAVPQDFQVSMVLDKTVLASFKGTDVTEGAPDALLAGGLNFTPEIADLILTANGDFIVSSISPIQPDGTPIIYFLRFE